MIFRRRAALAKLGERLLDANRTIGQPNKITVIFGRKITKQYPGKLQTEIEDMHLRNPVVRKAIEHLPALRERLSAIDDSYLDLQQDTLETFVERGHLQRLAKPTLTPTGKRIPGLKLDNPRQLALMHALVRFGQIPAANTFSTGEIHLHVVAALGCATEQYSLASLRYDLSKLRAKRLVEKLPIPDVTGCRQRDIRSV